MENIHRQSPQSPERIFAVALPERGVMEDRVLALRALVQAFGGTLNEVHPIASAGDEAVLRSVAAVAAHPHESHAEREAGAYLQSYTKLRETAGHLPGCPEHPVFEAPFTTRQTKAFEKQGYRSVIGMTDAVSTLHATVSAHELEMVPNAVVVELDFFTNFKPKRREIYTVGVANATRQDFTYATGQGASEGAWILKGKKGEAAVVAADKISDLADRLKGMSRIRGAYWQRS